MSHTPTEEQRELARKCRSIDQQTYAQHHNVLNEGVITSQNAADKAVAQLLAAYADQVRLETVNATLEIYERAFEQNWIVQDTIDAIRALAPKVEGATSAGKDGSNGN